ncbi:hypothetical protein LCGC14_0145760 [marine sediment metagenome]|uniref:Helicase ATP-binding domain-containing protein n=1 Tax=marine sediment metagenome TaxID=412755 RepID=A0A0F9UZT8_9ZZZZ
MNYQFYSGFTSELEKIAKVKTPLKEHQLRVVKRMLEEDQEGLVVAHGLGSGKTLTSLAVIDALKQPTDVVVPASLQDNYAKEQRKHTSGIKLEIQSLQNIARKRRVPSKPVLIIDEAHRARNPDTAQYRTLAASPAKKRMLLTASPIYNHPSDLAPLVNIAAGNKVLPLNKKDFENAYILKKKISPGFWKSLIGIKPGELAELNPDKRDELNEVMRKWVDYQENSREGFPEKTTTTIKVPMTEEQLKVHDSILGKAPFWVRMKVRAGLPPSKSESKQLNSFLTGTRQISNTTKAHQPDAVPQEPKIEDAFRRLKKVLKEKGKKGKAVVYSQYLSAGIEPYKRRLEEAKIPYGEFTGKMRKKERDQLIRDYNTGKKKVLLLSRAGGEGLDLVGTNLVQIMEPHWNNEAINQVIGRAVRYGSHAHLPKKDRKVQIQKFLARRPDPGFFGKLIGSDKDRATDEYLQMLADNKDLLNIQFIDLLKGSTSEQ